MLMPLLLSCVCLLIEAFFSSAEIAIVSADRAHIRELAATGHRGAKLVEDFLIAESATQQCHEGNRADRGGPLKAPSAGEPLCESPHGQIVDSRSDGTVSTG